MQSNSSLNYLAIYSENELHCVANEGGLLSLFFFWGEPTIQRNRQGQLHFASHSHSGSSVEMAN